MNRDYFPIIRAMCMSYGLPVPVPEYRFAAPRKWQFDFAWTDFRIALEVEGGVYIQGRHTRPKGFLKDMEKYNAAGVRGWTVLRITPSEVKKWATLDMIAEAMENKTVRVNQTINQPNKTHGKANKKSRSKGGNSTKETQSGEAISEGISEVISEVISEGG